MLAEVLQTTFAADDGGTDASYTNNTTDDTRADTRADSLPHMRQ